MKSWNYTWSRATRLDKPDSTHPKKKPNPTRLMRGPGSGQIFWPDKKMGQAQVEFFLSETWPNSIRPKFYIQKNWVWPNLTRPDHVTGRARAKKFSPMVGSGRVWAEKKCRIFLTQPEPDPINIRSTWNDTLHWGSCFVSELKCT